MVARFSNKTVPSETRNKMLGTSETDSLSILISDLQLQVDVDTLKSILHEIQRDALKEANLMPGAERLITHLHTNKVPIACASSSTLESIQYKTTKHKKLFGYMHHIVSGTDDPEVPHSKPAPDIFFVCASRFPDCPNPQNCLVFEDAPNGVKAANGACMQVVMVPSPKLDKQLQKDATLVLDSLNNFQPQLFCLPPFAKNC